MWRLKRAFVFLTFAAPIVLAPFLLGGAYTVVFFNRVLIGTVAVLFLGWAVWVLVAGKRLFVPFLWVPFLVLFGWSLLQVIPLPPVLLGILSPRAAYFYAASDLGGWRPLSLSLPETLYSLMRLGTLLLFALMLQRTIEGERREWRSLVTDTIIVTAVAVFALGVFLKMAGVTTWLGALLRGPLLIHPTLINMNHAAAFFGVAALLALARAVDADLARGKVFYGALFFVLFLGIIMTLSRGGILAFVLSLVLFFILRRLTDRKMSGGVVLAAFAVLAVVIAFYVGYHFIITEFDMDRPDYFDKLAVLGTVRDYVADFWLTGSGLGSFMHVYPFYQGDPGLFFTQLENEPVQLVLEQGVLVALVVSVFLVWFFVKYNRGARCRCGAAAALLFLAMHNTLDFNLHTLAVLFPAVAVYLMASGSFEVVGWRRIGVAGFGVALAGAVFWGVLAGDDLDFYAVKDTASYEHLIERYPSDFKVPLREAVTHYNRGDRDSFLAALPYLSEATAKAPEYYYLYFLNGSALFRLGSVEEGMALFAESVERAPVSRIEGLLKDIYARLGPRGLDRRMRELLPFDRADAHEGIARFIASISASPELVEHLLEGREALFFETAGEAYLARRKYELLETLVERVAPREQELGDVARGRLFMFRGHLLLQRGDVASALGLFERGSALTGSFNDIFFLAGLYIKHAPEKCATVDARLREKAFVRKEDLARYYRWKSDWLWSRGEVRSSLTYLQKGAEIGNYPQWRIEAARRLATQGLYEEAIAELTALKLSRRKIDEMTVDRLIESYRARLMEKQSDLMKDTLLRGKEEGPSSAK